jgi:outer membrane protein OmpA-like peptidoglycan-associated protein
MSQSELPDSASLSKQQKNEQSQFRRIRMQGRLEGIVGTCLLLAATLLAQQPDTQNPPQVEPMDKTPVFRVNVVGRTTEAVNYRHRGGSTKVDFEGTDRMREAKGVAKVDSKAGRLEINASFEHVRPATTFGPEYLTYVLWAITPEGRPMNLGEILVNEDGKSSIKVTTDLQAFGMIVTAEPYFAVTRPSDLVVLENIVRPDTKGWEQPISAKFDALEKGEYTVDIPAGQLPATAAINTKVPLELLEARNAVAIARAAGAEQYAPEAMAKANDFLARGEDYLKRKQNNSAIGTVARGATESAEDARLITLRKKEQERIAAEQRAADDRAAKARADAEAETKRRQEAELAKQQAQQAEAESQRMRADAEAARAAALEQQLKSQAETQKAEQATQAARQAQQQAEREKEEMRARLLQQLNQVLQTQDTARGLIVNMGDVLFDSGKATLKPTARERLAKISGIILAYPGLRLAIEGHTDNIGSDQYNMTLSDKRASNVREYLVSQGLPADSVTAQGFGKADPVASNDTASGRQLNRRVDMVVSGDVIGTPIGSTAGAPANASPPPAQP